MANSLLSINDNPSFLKTSLPLLHAHSQHQTNEFLFLHQCQKATYTLFNKHKAKARTRTTASKHVETGRYSGTPREARLCTLCTLHSLKHSSTDLRSVSTAKAGYRKNTAEAFSFGQILSFIESEDRLYSKKSKIQVARHIHQWRVGAGDGSTQVSKQSSPRRIAEPTGDADTKEREEDSTEGLWSSDSETKALAFPHTGRRLVLGVGLSVFIPSFWPSSGEAVAGEVAAVVVKTPPETSKKSSRAEEGSGSVFGSIEKGKGFRVYDANVLGEPVPLGIEKGKVWQKLLEARVIYLGEAEHVPDPEDKLIELEIIRTLRDKCFEHQRPVTLALEAFPCTIQTQLNKYMSKRLTDDELRLLVTNLPLGRWEEYLPILHFCKENGVRLMACGTPPEILLAVQAKGVQGLSDTEKMKYIPPIDSFGGQFIQRLALNNLLPNASFSFGPGSYQFAQARIVSDYVMAQVVTQAMTEGGAVGSLVVITGASHVKFGSRGVGLPARIAKKLKKKTQIVVLLNPERQHIRKEGEIPQADFLWYSAAKACVRNCFDRAEVARVMDAAGRRRYALPQDLQAGLERGIVSPEVLKSFFELDRQPLLAELTRRFQGLRERWLADPRFLQRLALEEAISITTTLMAQYERRKDRFWKELDYVVTDTIRGSVVDFFTVWLPAPRLAFRPLDTENTAQGVLEGLKGLLGSLPDNAFQRAQVGEHWDLRARLGAVFLGGGKLFLVGFISSLGTLSTTNALLFVRQYFDPQLSSKPSNKRSPIFKTALVYAAFLGTSANLRYQAIAGLVEHWVADQFLASEPLVGNILSFVARTANSYWGTMQWVDLARITGLQAHQSEPPETFPQDQLRDSHTKLLSDPVESKSSRKSTASKGGVESSSVEGQLYKTDTTEKSGVEGD